MLSMRKNSSSWSGLHEKETEGFGMKTNDSNIQLEVVRADQNY
jgi:hypothetical protein